MLICDKKKLSGVMPALMAAFDDDGIDCAKVATHVNKLKQSGVDGLYVGGSSSEMILCTESERMELLECSMEACQGLPIIAHVGSMSTRETLTLTKHAKKCGVDAVSSVTPLYFKYSFGEVKHFYERIAEASELPVIIYNIPGLTGSAYGYEQLCELLELPGICGMKFTSTDFYLLNRLVLTYPEKIFYNGCDEALLSGLAAGADGGIGTTYNYMPDVIGAVYNCFRNGDIQAAKSAQNTACRVISASIKYGIPGCKELLRLLGTEYGTCREPFLPIGNVGVEDLVGNTLPILAAWRQEIIR